MNIYEARGAQTCQSDIGKTRVKKLDPSRSFTLAQVQIRVWTRASVEWVGNTVD